MYLELAKIEYLRDPNKYLLLIDAIKPVSKSIDTIELFKKDLDNWPVTM